MADDMRPCRKDGVEGQNVCCDSTLSTRDSFVLKIDNRKEIVRCQNKLDILLKPCEIFHMMHAHLIDYCRGFVAVIYCAAILSSCYCYESLCLRFDYLILPCSACQAPNHFPTSQDASHRLCKKRKQSWNKNHRIFLIVQQSVDM